MTTKLGLFGVPRTGASATNNWVDSFSDAVTSADTQSVVAHGVGSFSGSVTAADTQSVVAHGVGSFSGSVTAAASNGVSLHSSLSFSGSVAAVASNVVNLHLNKTISDSIAASDTITALVESLAVIADVVAALDDIEVQLPPPLPNVILSGTFAFESSYRLMKKFSTRLDFTIITGDDSIVKVLVKNKFTSEPIDLTAVAASVSLYNLGTDNDPVLVKGGSDIIFGNGFLIFTLSSTDSENLTLGKYQWLATVTFVDGTVRTINLGDIDLTTGYVEVVERP